LPELLKLLGCSLKFLLGSHHWLFALQWSLLQS
jgi:hypothetical protein